MGWGLKRVVKMIKAVGGMREGAEQEKGVLNVTEGHTELKDHRFVRASVCLDTRLPPSGFLANMEACKKGNHLSLGIHRA